MTTILELRHRWHAIALSLLGHECSARATVVERTGAVTLQWVCRTRVPEASAIIAAAELPAADPRSIHTISPQHPFLICLYALEAADILHEWLAAPAHPPAFIRPGLAPLIRLQRGAGGTPCDLAPLIWGHTLPAASVACIHSAAALITAGGFIPRPVIITDASGRPSLSFAAESFTRPGLRLHDMPRLRELSLDGFPPGGHPVQWARLALSRLATVAAVESTALRDPALLMKGIGQRAALVTQSLLDPGGSATLKDRLQPHLHGLTA